MEKTNMVELTDDEVLFVADRQAVGCLVLVLCGAVLLACALGWMVYLVCVKCPALGHALPPVGFVALGAAAHMVWSSRRNGVRK